MHEILCCGFDSENSSRTGRCSSQCNCSFFPKLRTAIAEKQQERAAQFAGEIELDESYFGAIRKEKRGRKAAGKVAVSGILKRGGNIYTQTILDAKTDTLMPIIRQKITPCL
ncbi:MAG: transposase, partial [Alphaproteobacteria bacterium]|nr:transposase [Alphaproteobacteria bacterium]